MNFSRKYTVDEIERRWLVNESLMPDLNILTCWEVEDLYIYDSRMRLRVMHHSQSGEEVFKLCKKYGVKEGYSEPITNIYLTQKEYNLFKGLSGDLLRKRKYSFPHKGYVFSIEQFIMPERKFFLCEAEFKSITEAQKVQPPSFVGREVTEDDQYSGAVLAKK